MSYNYSYNVIIDRLKAFADGHFLIRRFTHGSINLSDLPQDGQYPFMHVAPDAFIPVEGGMRFALMVSFFDIPRDKELKAEYQKEALSDCTRLAQDLISEIQANRVLFGPEVSLSNLPEIEPWLEEKKNTVTGVSMLLDIEVPHFWSGCDIPAEYAVGGNSTGGYGSDGVSLILKTNSVDNNVQSVLDLVQGANITITDLGDGRVQIAASGSVGATWGTIGGVLSNQADLQTLLDTKVNEADLALVAISGDYNDLDNLPTIPAEQVNSDWNSISGVSEILNKPTIPNELRDLSDVNVSGPLQNDTLLFDAASNEFINEQLGAVAYSNDYNDLANLPTIPAVIGDMTKAVYDTDDDGIVDSAERIEIIVRNSTGVTITKGQVVYLSGATGNRPNALLASASTEATSSKTIGFAVADIANNSDGNVAVNGTLHDLDTSAFTDGATLWLSETAGAMQANTPPAEPAHAVFLGYVARSHPNLGRVVIQVQNGYELNELHGVVITDAQTDEVLMHDSDGLWKNKSVDTDKVLNTSTVGGINATEALDSLASDVSAKQDAITLTTSGTSGAASLIGNTLNIPNYTTATAAAVIKSVNQANHTGTTAETIIFSGLMPIALAANDQIDFSHFLGSNVTNGSTIIWRGYINTQNNLTGAIEIYRFTNSVGTATGLILGRRVMVNSVGASGVIRFWNPAQLPATSQPFFSANAALLTGTLNTTGNIYFILTCAISASPFVAQMFHINITITR